MSWHSPSHGENDWQGDSDHDISFADIMIRKRLYMSFVELHVLHHAADAPVYGLWMIQELTRHGYRLGPSQLYPCIHRLERGGLLSRREKVVAGKLRKYYQTTAAGRAFLSEQKARLLELVLEIFSTGEIEELAERRLSRTAQTTGTY